MPKKRKKDRKLSNRHVGLIALAMQIDFRRVLRDIDVQMQAGKSLDEAFAFALSNPWATENGDLDQEMEALITGYIQAPDDDFIKNFESLSIAGAMRAKLAGRVDIEMPPLEDIRKLAAELAGKIDAAEAADPIPS